MQGRSPQTVVCNRVSLVHLDAWLNERNDDPADLDPTIVEVYFFGLAKALAAGTRRNRLVHIRAAYQYAIKLRRIEHDPTITLQTVKVDDSEPESRAACYPHVRRPRLSQVATLPADGCRASLASSDGTAIPVPPAGITLARAHARGSGDS
jgi:hypothetical protein